MRIKIHETYHYLKKFLHTIPDIFESGDGAEVARHAHLIKRFEAPDDTMLIVKRYRVPGFLTRLRRTWGGKSSAARAYENARRLRHHRIDVPSPVCYIDTKRLGLYHRSYFVMKERKQDSCSLLRDAGYPDVENMRIAFMRFVLKMHSKGILQHDLSLSNFLFERCVKEGDRHYRVLPRWNADGTPTPEGAAPVGETIHYHFVALDTDRVSFKKSLTRRQCLDNLATITTDTELLKQLTVIYARERSWEEKECVSHVMDKATHLK